MHYYSLSEPQIARRYFEAAESNGERFVEETRRQTRRFDSQEFNSILACSRLLTVLGFAFYRTHRANGVTLSDAAGWTWLHLLRGVKSVYTAMLESDTELDPTMSLNMVPELPQNRGWIGGTPTGGMQWHRTHYHFRFIQETQEERFECLFASVQSRKADFSQEEMKDLSAAIVSLEQVTKHICTGEVHSLYRAICTWPGYMSIGFMDMLLRKEHFALAVYAHWLMLVVLAEHMWWIDDMGVAVIREIADICSSYDSSVKTMLTWPMKMLDAVL